MRAQTARSHSGGGGGGGGGGVRGHAPRKVLKKWCNWVHSIAHFTLHYFAVSEAGGAPIG